MHILVAEISALVFLPPAAQLPPSLPPHHPPLGQKVQHQLMLLSQDCDMLLGAYR